jgi:hypothetical protein
LETKGYIEIEGVMYRLVSRQKSNHRQIRVRSKGQLGVRLNKEEDFFRDNRDFLKKLLKDSEIDIPIGRNNAAQE